MHLLGWVANGWVQLSFRLAFPPRLSASLTPVIFWDFRRSADVLGLVGFLPYMARAGLPCGPTETDVFLAAVPGTKQISYASAHLKQQTGQRSATTQTGLLD